jgi:hypothetical protein
MALKISLADTSFWAFAPINVKAAIAKVNKNFIAVWTV